MSFLRHGESIDPMTFVSLGASGLAHSQCSSASMSSSRLFLGRLLSSRACFHFAGHERFSKTEPSRTMIFQRTATTPLIPCLSPRVQSSLSPSLGTSNVEARPQIPTKHPELLSHASDRPYPKTVLPPDLFKQFHLTSPVHRPPRPWLAGTE
jgi:hypothetical protein